ncbi:hypothetical protein BKA62DRAFT_121564 [Auriculariales sp. MPI-PUGE-AT-0066]|nr:hypothetical protein BKA62DRAFT_121564 [Auriculariales sp. MPI-PUGE-AT-0066]
MQYTLFCYNLSRVPRQCDSFTSSLGSFHAQRSRQLLTPIPRVRYHGGLTCALAFRVYALQGCLPAGMLMSARLAAASCPSSAPLLLRAMSTIASSPAAPQSAARAVADPPLPDAVVHLQRSMEVLEAAALTLVGRKSLDSKTKENARLLVATGNRLTSAIVAACQHRQGDLRILAKVHVSVARESIDEWTTIVSERGMRSGFASFRSRSDTASQVRTFTLAMQVLVEMMEIENGIAGLVLDPARCLGLSEAKPTSVSHFRMVGPCLTYT